MNGAAGRRTGWTVALLAGLLAACSGVTPYRNTLAPNVQVHKDTASNVRAALDVYRVDAQCRAVHQGRVDLDETTTPVGLSVGRPSLLVVSFTTSRFLGSSTHRIGREVLLIPRRGHRYDVRATYRDDIYQVALREHGPRNGGARELALEGLDACRPAR